MDKKKFALVISILLVVAMMVACGAKNNGDKDHKEPSTETTGAAEETTEATEETTQPTEEDIKIEIDENGNLVIPDKNTGSSGNTGNGNSGSGNTGNGNTGSSGNAGGGNSDSGNTGSSESTGSTENTEPQKPTGSGADIDIGDFFN